MPLVNTFFECLAGDGPWDETSTRYGDMATIAEYAFPTMYILLVNIALVLEMVPPAEVAMEVARGQRLWLAHLGTLVSKLSDCLLHDVNQGRELVLPQLGLAIFNKLRIMQGGLLQMLRSKIQPISFLGHVYIQIISLI